MGVTYTLKSLELVVTQGKPYFATVQSSGCPYDMETLCVHISCIPSQIANKAGQCNYDYKTEGIKCDAKLFDLFSILHA